ncbi:MAG: hypothetical protein HWD58_12865 [Bacteroidota bacterium]|nr:MAG: hypothetical protein HWD58_12865 [Bacteroidota bacterium]
MIFRCFESCSGSLFCVGHEYSHPKSNTTSLENRWQQLRESGVCIFDFSAFQPQLADPIHFVAGDEVVETPALRAASGIATVAFECGWALSLGKPMVVLIRSGQSVPFDIDIHPCILQGDATDADAIIAALQIAMYGKPRISEETILESSRNYLMQKASRLTAPEVQPIVEGIQQTGPDATMLKHLGMRFLDYLPAKNHLAIQPPFASMYPTDDGPEKVFHVTAFRPWMWPQSNISALFVNPAGSCIWWVMKN